MVVTYRLTTLDFIVFALVVLFVPAIVGWGIGGDCGRGVARRAGRVHAVICGLLLGAVVANFVKVSTPLPAVRVSRHRGRCGPRSRCDSSSALSRRAAVAAVLGRRAPHVRVLLFVTASPASVLLGDGAAHPLSVTIRRPARVVMLVLDEFPEESLLDGNGHVDAALFPNFAALADASTWYRNDTTVAEYTCGRCPRSSPASSRRWTRRRRPPASIRRACSRCSASTYRLNVHETAEQVCPDVLCGAIADGEGSFASSPTTVSW